MNQLPRVISYRALVIAIVSLARLGASCEPSKAAEIDLIPPILNLPAMITIKGVLGDGDIEKFKYSSEGLDQSMVFFGKMDDEGDAGIAIELGEEIRSRHYITSVIDGSCGSLCALAWLGGSRRYLMQGNTIHFHDQQVVATSEAKSGLVSEKILRTYLSKLGLSKKVFRFLSNPTDSDREPLDIAALRLRGIDVLPFKPSE